ncbi:MAG TPA: 23S rRNA (adenine(2503)-C(2))-methyltransferase RlmN [Candidatus Margulisiibacteriota bacterium]|nr:23S rRNA (adenine(2503)-C(2))-methyltransferase RlmN [Candidatus Margulisiibacteriota bacterium]
MARAPVALTPAALRAWLAAEGESAYRATQILSWVYRRHASSFAAMSNLPQTLRAALESHFLFPRLTPALVVESADDTRKLLFKLDARAAIESVLIPDPPRLTLCISSQAGCGMACAFCATARLGLVRNLTATEIAGQVLAAQQVLRAGERISNVVFMGMGEPLANYDAVVQAIELLTADWGIGLSARRITVSTVGLVPAMQRLVGDTNVQLAVSLSATTDAQRERLMPVNRRYPLETLMAMCRSLPIPQRRRITFEYVMLAGVNDSLDDAARLVRLLRGIPAKVNLIPFNPFPGAGFACSSAPTILRFQERLLTHNVHATIRQSRGRDIQAACGQLALAGRTLH